MTSLSSRFQCKNWLWKIGVGSWDIDQNVPKSRLPNQTCIFWYILANILGPDAYLLKPIFALKPWPQAGRFEYHEPYKRNKFFFRFRGGCQNQRGQHFQINLISLLKCSQKKCFAYFLCAWPYKGRANTASTLWPGQ